MRLSSLLFILGFTASASAVHASDGVFEINADCATVGGCFDGDSSGYPVSITQQGSYRLTGNLTTNNVNTTLISVSAEGVSIDLNGFSLQGPVSCSGIPVSCTSSGSGDGIDAESIKNLTVRNGTIRGMGRDGLLFGPISRIEDLTVSENGRNGVNGTVGVVAGSSFGSLLSRLAVNSNNEVGVILGFNPSYLTDSNIFNNGNLGISGGFCGNVLSTNNVNGDSCTAIAPNVCSDPADCD